MQYNKNEFNKVNDKKVMKKVKKQWVVVSIATLALLGASAYGMTNTSQVVAHAEATVSGASQDQLKSSAASQGSSDGTAGNSRSTVSSSFQSDYDAAYSSASTSASLAASSAGTSDFAAGKHISSYANHQDAYDSAYDAASSAASLQVYDNSVAASSNAVSAGVSDYLNGKSQSYVENDNDVYSNAYNSVSAGFSSAASANVISALKGTSNVSQSSRDLSFQKGLNSESLYQEDMVNAANDAYNGVNNSKKLTGIDQSIYSAAYTGATAVLKSYASKNNGKGTGTQDYNYYVNTAGSGSNTVSGASQNTSQSANNGSGNTYGVTDANSTGGTTAPQSSYYAPNSNSYTANISANVQSNIGGADDPTSAHNSAVQYENELGKHFNNQYYASIKNHDNISIPVEDDINNQYNGANSAAFKFGVEYILAKLGIQDAETGKWVGVDSSQNKGTSSTLTFDFYVNGNEQQLLNDTSNIYAQAYLGAKQAIQNQFNQSYQIQSISDLNDDAKSSWYQMGYSDVQHQSNQGVAFVTNGNQLNYLLTGTSNSSSGTMYNSSYTNIKIVNDIYVGNTADNSQHPISGDFSSLYIDGQNHLIDFGLANYNFNSTSDIHVQNFSAMYGNNYYGPISHAGSGAIYFKNINYIGNQMLSATGNDVYVDGSVNSYQRDKTFSTPFATYTWPNDAQNNLAVKNMILGANSHFFASTGYYLGQNVVYLTGNLTLGNNSSMTLVPRGYGRGGDDGAGSGSEGLYIAASSTTNPNPTLNVNKGATLNVIPDWSTGSTSTSAGGIYVGSGSTINVDGGQINIEANQDPETYGYPNVLMFVDGGTINVTNGGLVQAKANGLGSNSSYSLVYLNGSTSKVNVANQGNFIVTIPDQSGKGISLINGTLNVVDSGQSHVILDRGNNNNNFVSNGSINAYTAKVTNNIGTTIYYKYNVDSSNNVTSLDQYLNTNQIGEKVSGNHIELESVPSVYFAGPIHAKKNYDSSGNLTSITVSGYSKVTDNPNNQNIYIQYSTSTDNSSSLTNNYLVSSKNGTYIFDETKTKGTSPARIDNTAYTDTLSGNNSQSLIPFSFKVDANTLKNSSYNVSGGKNTNTQTLSSINKVGVYLKYGVNGIYMTSNPTDSGNGDYQIYIDGFDNSGNNNTLSPITSSPSQIALNSGSGAKIDSGISAATKDSGGATPLNRDITLYQKDQAYTNAYNSAQNGYDLISQLTPEQLKTILGSNFDITQAPASLTTDQLKALMRTDAYNKSDNPDAFISGAEQSYEDLLAGKDAANAINSSNQSAIDSDNTKTNNYKTNFKLSYSIAQSALNDAKSGQDNEPSDETQKQIYDSVKKQYENAKNAFDNGNIEGNNSDAVNAGNKVFESVLNDIQNGLDSSSNNSQYNTLTPLQKSLYDAEYNSAKQNYDEGTNAFIAGETKPTNRMALQAYNEADDGFNGANNTSPESQTAAYKAGQKAKTDSQDGATRATTGQSLPATPSQAETDGFNATKDALDAATGKQTKLTDDQLKQKSLAYQAAYNKALALAGQAATNALADYKSGSQANRPQGNGLDRQAYDKVQNDAAAGASDANNANSADTPASDKTPAYKTGYDIAKGVSDAENGKSKDNSANKDQEYTDAYNNFNDGKAQGESAKLTDSAPANADPAIKAGFEYGQGIAALKNAQNPATANDPQGLTAKQQEGYDQAKSGYDLALSGQQAPTSPAAAVEGYNYAKALTDGASASTRPTQATGKDDLATEQKAYDDVQAAVAQAKSDARTSNPTPNDGSAHNKDVYDKAYAAALKAYQNSDPSATASSKGINNDVIGAAAFNAAKADGLKLQGANLFTNGSANNQSDPTITDGYNEAKQGYAYALHGKASQPNASDAYALGYNAASNDKSGFQSAENGTPDNSEAAKGAADAIAKVKNAKGNVDSLSEINDSSKPAAYNNAYNAALEDAKQAARQGIASQLTPDSTNTQAPVPAALADVYKAAANDAQKGYAEGLTGKSVSNGNNTSESKGFQKGSGDAAAYEAAVQDYANANGDVNAAKAAHPEKENDSVYQQTLKALDEGAKGITDSNDKSPVYAVANSQALAKKAAMDAIKAANTSANGTVPSRINSINDVPAGVSDKQSYMNAYNDAIKGYNAGKDDNPSVTADNSDPADQQAFKDAKAAGEAARGADALLDGSTTAKDVDGTNANPSYIAGVDEASSGYADGLNGTKTAPEDVQTTPAYQKAYAQGQADQAGVSAAKETQNPDTNTAPDTLPSNAAKDAYLGYANAIAAVKNAHGNPSAIQTPANYSQQSSDYKAAYQKALQDAVDANKAGQYSVANPSSAAARPSDTAQAAVYDAARADASKGYAEGLTGKSVSDPNNGNEQAGLQAGANDKAKYEAAVNDYATANGNVDAAKAADPANASDPVYKQTLKALDDASKGRTDVNDKSPVYAVANSQALAKKAAMDAINDANKAANGTDPQQITDANNVPADVPDKQSYMNAFNDAIKGYNAGKADDSSVKSTNSDPADQQAFKDAKAAGEAALGADDALNGKKANADVATELNSTDPAQKAYAQGVTDANDGYNDGLSGTNNASQEVQATPAYQKAYAQGQADQKGVNEAKAQGTPDSNNVPSDLQGNKPATDAFKGYADAIAAVKAKNGNAAQTDRPTDFNSQSPDYKAAYQKALEDAIAANKAGQNAVATPGKNDTKPTDPALAAVYNAAKHDTNKGMAEVLSGKQGSSNPNNANEQAGIQAGTPLQAAYQAAARDFAAGNTDPTHIDQIAQTFGDTAQAYKDALAGMMDGSQTPASDQNDPKSSSPIYALAKQQAQNVQNAVAAVKGSQNVASGQSDKDADLASANGYNNPDNKSDMDDAYIAAANAYSDAINHTNGDEPTDQSGFSPADQVAYAQAYKAAKDAAAKGLTDFGNGNKNQQPTNPADKAAYDKAQSDALAGLNDGLTNQADTNKQDNNPAYKQGVVDAAAIKKAAEDAVNGTPAGKSSLSSDGQQAYDAIKPAADAGQSEYTDYPDKYAGKTGDDLKNAANQAAQDMYPNDPLKQAAFAQAIESAGDAFGKGADAFGNGESQPTGIAAAGYQSAQQAYNAATNGTGKPEKVNGHYPTPQGVTPSDQYDKTFDAAYGKYKAAVDKAAQDTAANGGTATKADDSNVYKTATPKEQADYNDAATKAAKGIADAKLDDLTKDAQYGTTKDGKFVPNDDTAAQAYAGAKAGYADGKSGTTNEPTNVSPAYKAAYDKANADAKAAAHAGVEDFAQGLSAANPTEDAQAAKNAHSNGYNQASAGYQAAINNPSGDFSSNPDASYQKGVDMAKAAAAARDNVLNNGDNAQPTQGETSTDPDVQGAAKAAAAAAKAALADGKNGLDKVTNTAQVPDAFKPYAQIYADAYATVQDAATKAAQNGALNFASDGKEGSHNTDNNDKSVDAVANQKGYDDANKGYQAAQSNPDESASSNSGSVNEDEAAKGAAAAFNDVAGKDNAKPGDHATSDNNPVYKAAYQKALAEGRQNASDGAEALFNNNPNNSTANASTLAKPNATTAADKAFNKGLENAKNALADAQANDPSKDAQYAGNNADTDAGNVYHATQDAYNAVLNGQQPLTASQLASKDPVYAAAYKNALSHAQTASTNGATDTNDNGSSYAPNSLAQAVYEKARNGANNAYKDALQNKDPELKDHNGIDKGSVAYQATQNAINDYLKNNGNAKEDPTAAGMDPANAQAYKAYYEKAKAAVAQAATDGVNAYLGGKAIDDVPSVEGDNTGLGQVAKEAAERAEKGHEDAVNNDGRVSDANQPIATDPSYLTGLKGAQDAAKGVAEAKADATKQPDVAAPQAEKDGFNGTVDGYNKAATDGSIKPQDIDAYIAANLGNKSIAYRDAFKNAYLDGLKVAKAGADAANANEPDATNGQNGAAQKDQSQGYKDATNAFLDKLHGVDDKDATSNTPSSVAGRQRASQYLLALQDVAEGHPNTGSTDPDYQKGLATAQAAVAQAVADAKANKQLPADLSQIPVPDGSDPVAYRDAYAGILSGFYNGYNSKSTDSGSTDAYYNIAFGIGYAKGKASIPTDTSAPLDFWKNDKAPKITDPAVAKAYKEQYAQAKAGFYDALKKRGSKSNNEYYKESYKTAMDGLAGMRLAAKGDTKANRDILKTKDAAFISGYNGYLKGIEAAKRTLKKNKKLSAKDLLNKDKLYSYTFKEGLKHEIKIQRSHGKKAGINKALERHAIPKDIYTHHSATYARTFVATYKKEMKRHMPRYIYNVGTIFTHNRVKFTNHTRIREYAYSARYNSTVFRVVGVKYYKNRIPRYRLSNGDVVTASQQVQSAYYKKQYKEYRVIKPTGTLIHTGKTFSEPNSVRRLYRGEVFHVRKVVKFHGITRLYVGKNEYITSNKTYVKAVIK